METNSDEDQIARLKQIQSNITITPELFEKLYLAPKEPVAGDLRKTFGNPTPIAIIGFLIGLQPIAFALMGWRGSGGGGNATTGASLAFGGLLLFTGGIMEWILGNSFPSIVFISFSAHFVTIALTYIPWYNAVGTFDNGGQTQTPEFIASFGFYLLSMTMWSFIILLCTIRTNAIFVLAFITVTTGFGLITGGTFAAATGNVTLSDKLIFASGACFFTTSLLGWYFVAALMLSIMDLPSPPVWDLSTVVKGVSQRKAAKSASPSKASPE